MAVDVETQIVIARPLPRVSAFAADPDNVPRWYVNIRSVEWVTAPGVRVGARVAFVAQFLGRRMAYTYEIADWKPGEHLVMRTAEGPFPMETTYRWEACAEGTRMTLRNRGNPSGFSVIAAPFLSMAMRRANRKDLARLKSVLEEGPA